MSFHCLDDTNEKMLIAVAMILNFCGQTLSNIEEESYVSLLSLSARNPLFPTAY